MCVQAKHMKSCIYVHIYDFLPNECSSLCFCIPIVNDIYAVLSVCLLAISPILTFLLSWDETTGQKPTKCIAQSALPAGFQLDLPMGSTRGECKLGEGGRRGGAFFSFSFWVWGLPSMLIIKSSDVVAAAGRAGPSSDRSRRHHLLGRVSAPTSCTGTPVWLQSKSVASESSSEPLSHQCQVRHLQVHVRSLAFPPLA